LQEQLSQLRDAALGQARDDGERAALAPRLEAMRSGDPRIATFVNMINDKRLKYELGIGPRPGGGNAR
jgi:hypothetical protein